jgi:hypothetical protein
MIDNVVLLITGTLHERDLTELLEKCHPLGMFESISSLSSARSVNDLYDYVLVDTPLGMPSLSLSLSLRSSFEDSSRSRVHAWLTNELTSPAYVLSSLSPGPQPPTSWAAFRRRTSTR